MKTTLRWTFSVGLVLTSGLTGRSHTAAAASSDIGLAITIHVHDYAGAAPETLAEAEEVATQIFRKAGVETRWVDVALTAENEELNSDGHPAFTLADIQLRILPREMSDRFGLPNNVMGLAPGTGPDRRMVYVFDSQVQTLFWRLLSTHHSCCTDRHVSKTQILGHAIAHELGHLLLNQQVHSEHGIMRGDWGFTDLQDASYGLLLFTPREAEVLRAEGHRRTRQQEALNVAVLESQVQAMPGMIAPN
jgi:hypothetical protein